MAAKDGSNGAWVTYRATILLLLLLYFVSPSYKRLGGPENTKVRGFCR